MSSDELLDLLDDGQPIGTIWRSQMGDNRNVRTVNAFLRNSAGQLFIPRRTAHKKHFPSALDFSVGGYVQAGENYEAALEREAHEELNLDLTADNFRLLAEFNPHRSGLSSFMRVYEIGTNETPQLNPSDFSGGEWLLPAELRSRLQASEAAKGDLLRVLNLVYS